MIVQRRSSISGKVNSMDLPVTREQLEEWLRLSESGEAPLIQYAFPNLNDEEREFLRSGISPEEWDEMFSDYEDDHDQDYAYYDEENPY